MIAGRVIKKIVCAMAVLLAAYVASYVVLRAVNYIHVIGGVGLGGNGYQVECCWLDSNGKPRFYTVGTVVLHFFWPCWQIECEMKMRSSANKITGPNAVGPRQFSIRTLLAARVGQFHRWAQA
jgi:hypothetical protein